MCGVQFLAPSVECLVLSVECLVFSVERLVFSVECSVFSAQGAGCRAYGVGLAPPAPSRIERERLTDTRVGYILISSNYTYMRRLR